MEPDEMLEMQFEDRQSQTFELGPLSEEFADDAEFECHPDCRQGDHHEDCEWYDAVYG